MVPASPPGGMYERKLPESETKEPPAAIGEQPLSSRGASTSTASAKADLLKVEPALPTAKGETKTTASGVKYETIKQGTGPEAKTGQRVKVHYTGTLDDGKQFDSSRGRGEPFSFVLGERQVIIGWEEGVAGMKVGEQRKLTIPPKVGYGETGKGDIPPNATLHFDVELMGVE